MEKAIPAASFGETVLGEHDDETTPGDRGRPTVTIVVAEEGPPSKPAVDPDPLAEDVATLVDRHKPVSREGWQGRRNDTAAAEDEPRHVMAGTLAAECRSRAIGADW